MKAENVVVWVNKRTHEVMVHEWEQSVRFASSTRSCGWVDPIGKAYAQWQQMSDGLRVLLMLETAIDLAMQGFDLGNVLAEFAGVDEFKALGSESIPMCRALTKALVGQCLEPNTMTFEELLEAYK